MISQLIPDSFHRGVQIAQKKPQRHSSFSLYSKSVSNLNRKVQNPKTTIFRWYVNENLSSDQSDYQ